MSDRNRALNTRYLEIMALLTMQENELKLEEALIDQKAEIFNSYLTWLDMSGAVSELPLKNYLHGSLPGL